MRKKQIIIFAIIFTSFIIGLFLYQKMPEKMASHWDFRGEVDDYLSRFWGLFLMPLLSLGLFLLFLFIPRMDPLKENVEKFRKYFDNFIVLVILFLFYLYLLTIFWNLGKRFSLIQFLAPALAVLFYYAGVLVTNAKMNWFIGIRTPWTLSSERVWEKTHKIGGKLFKVVGIISLLGIIFPRQAIFFILFPVIFVAFYSFVYSYLEYKKEVKI
jgi:uncharacterized membrane protein